MHSTTIDGVIFHHNGDFSGNVLITLPTEKVEKAMGETVFVEIDFEVVKKLVLKYFQSKIIGKVESMEYEELEERMEQIIL